jgi:hypothetical protein
MGAIPMTLSCCECDNSTCTLSAYTPPGAVTVSRGAAHAACQSRAGGKTHNTVCAVVAAAGSAVAGSS